MMSSFKSNRLSTYDSAGDANPVVLDLISKSFFIADIQQIYENYLKKEKKFCFYVVVV
jgi:hypothetical protein